MAIVLCPERWQLPAAIAAKQSDLIHGQARDFKYVVVQIRAPDMVCMYKVVVKIALTAASDVLDKRDAMAAHTLLLSIHQNLGDSEDDRPPELDLVSELRTNDLDFVDAYSDLNVARQMLITSDAACRDCPQLETHLALLDQALLLEQTLRDSGLRAAVNDENVELMNDFQQRLDVLQALGYIDEHRIVQLKGRVAAEVNTCDALIVSELVFENVLTDLPPDEAVALLSALVFQQKNTPEQLELVPESLRQAVAKVKTLTTGLAHLQLKKGIRVTAEEYLRDNLNFGLLHVVYEWAQGTTFAKICELTEVDEGTIVRCITRLDETCRDVRNCARVIGDPALFQKAQKASEIIKRDICFAASLYLN
jgi:antiviral helicase SKI2